MTVPTSPSAGHAPLIQVLYLSEALAGPDEVGAIAAHARRKNAALGLGGVLLFSGGHFAQLIEGPDTALLPTLAAIAADGRHRRYRELLRRGVAQRLFDGWGMTLVGSDGGDELMRSLLAQPHIDEARALRLLGHIAVLSTGALSRRS